MPDCKGNPLMPRLSVSDSASAPDASSAFRCVFRLCVLCLPMCLPPPDASSASRLVFRLQTCLPHCLPPWSCLLPAFSQHSLAAGTIAIPRHSAMSRPVCSASPLASATPLRLPLYCCTFRHTASLPLLCRILWLHHCVSRHSAMPSGCSTLLTHCAMSRDAVPPTHYRLRPATASDPPSSSTRFPLVSCWRATWRCTLHISIDFGLIFYIRYLVY